MSTTNFMNVRRRVIHLSPRGAYYVMLVGSKKRWGIKARFLDSATGRVRRLTQNNAIPAAIRPKVLRKSKPELLAARRARIHAAGVIKKAFKAYKAKKAAPRRMRLRTRQL